MAGLVHMLGSAGNSTGSSSAGASSQPFREQTDPLQQLFGLGEKSQLAGIARIMQMLQQNQKENTPPPWLTQPLIRVPGLSFLLKAFNPQGDF